LLLSTGLFQEQIRA